MHLVCTFDTNSSTGYIYVDGNEKSRVLGSSNLPLTTDWGARAIIGDYDFDIRHLNGQLDDFYMFDYSLSREQIYDMINKKPNCKKNEM
ncbi:hypothetical protein MXB_3228 [Myxobolus squamalis]|nr:hypothetical protein MXB_3228 [Myxobolus squamalis]